MQRYGVDLDEDLPVFEWRNIGFAYGEGVVVTDLCSVGCEVMKWAKGKKWETLPRVYSLVVVGSAMVLYAAEVGRRNRWLRQHTMAIIRSEGKVAEYCGWVLRRASENWASKILLRFAPMISFHVLNGKL